MSVLALQGVTQAVDEFIAANNDLALVGPECVQHSGRVTCDFVLDAGCPSCGPIGGGHQVQAPRVHQRGRVDPARLVPRAPVAHPHALSLDVQAREDRGDGRVVGGRRARCRQRRSCDLEQARRRMPRRPGVIQLKAIKVTQVFMVSKVSGFMGIWPFSLLPLGGLECELYKF